MNNKSKLRKKGLILLTEGKSFFNSIPEACEKQTWNKIVLGSFQISDKQPIIGLFKEFFSQINRIDYPQKNIKNFQFCETNTESVINTIREITPPLNKDIDEKTISAFFKEFKTISDKSGSSIGPGFRLILTARIHGRGNISTPQSMGISDKMIEVLDKLPERIIIVLYHVIQPFPVKNLIRLPHSIYMALPEVRSEINPLKLKNDIPAGDDLLRIRDEVYSLADTLALEQMKPPMVAGVMGGCGSGKSFVFHRIKQRLKEIRSRTEERKEKSKDNKPFISNPYIIEFDAWTYAKCNLWASLMQKIFLCLNQQITFEDILDKLKKDGVPFVPDDWKRIYDLHEDEIRYIKYFEDNFKGVKCPGE